MALKAEAYATKKRWARGDSFTEDDLNAMLLRIDTLEKQVAALQKEGGRRGAH